MQTWKSASRSAVKMHHRSVLARVRVRRIARAPEGIPVLTTDMMRLAGMTAIVVQMRIDQDHRPQGDTGSGHEVDPLTEVNDAIVVRRRELHGGTAMVMFWVHFGHPMMSLICRSSWSSQSIGKQ